jgi:hypothetical protein
MMVVVGLVQGSLRNVSCSLECQIATKRVNLVGWKWGGRAVWVRWVQVLMCELQESDKMPELITRLQSCHPSSREWEKWE